MANIDDSYIWQRRIHHGIRDQKGPVPFPSSVAIGLEFNAAFERKEKLDLCLLTNGVMLELCDFARTVTRSEKYFLFEVLEFNFDLGLDTDNNVLCYDYASRVHIKIKQVKEQIKQKFQKYRKIFTLPNVYTINGKYYPRYLKRNKMDTLVCTDGNKDIQIGQMTDNHGITSRKLSIRKKGGVLLKQTADYPFCRELGVTLAVQSSETSKQKLDPKLLTNGVMLELLDFSRGLCGSQTQIICALVEQNFGLVLDKLRFRLQLQKMIERKNCCPTVEDKDAYRKEMFQVQSAKQDQRCKKRPNPDTAYQQVETEISAAKRRQSDAREPDQDSDLSYTCPIDFETEMLAGASVGAEKVPLESSLLRTAAGIHQFVLVDVKKEEEEDVISPVRPQTNGLQSHLVRAHSEDDALSRLFSEDKAQNIKEKTHEQKLWMRRTIRSKQILKSKRINDLFAQCRKIGLDFNVSSGNKQKLDLQLLTNQVLVEILRFAAAMRRAISFFLFDILDKNFNLPHHDELHCRNLICHINSKTKILQNHPAIERTEFLNRPFPFPEAYNLTKVTNTETEQQIISALHWQTEKSYPFCKKLGINLWATEKPPATQKLHLSDLTTGAMLEIMSFVQELRGTVYNTVSDILQHNFDLGLQSESTRVVQEIQKWYFKQKKTDK
ncbi:uncharacterized protein LOC115054459 [Echeneis naucrates]|uniref:uncharacterized protein LOC115054459 n=1 Tax=Echeneis naucrates TaxID=173247 RepID=UPI001113EF9B|nr:uncharacterized protein LOC115054459 [Echeneis naucrates]